MSKYVYMFGGGTADGDGTMKDTLGGKGSGLAEMSRAGVPVPPGFTIITDVCNVFFDNDKKVPGEVDDEIWESLKKLEKLSGKKLTAEQRAEMEKMGPTSKAMVTKLAGWLGKVKQTQD